MWESVCPLSWKILKETEDDVHRGSKKRGRRKLERRRQKGVRGGPPLLKSQGEKKKALQNYENWGGYRSRVSKEGLDRCSETKPASSKFFQEEQGGGAYGPERGRYGVRKEKGKSLESGASFGDLERGGEGLTSRKDQKMSR